MTAALRKLKFPSLYLLEFVIWALAIVSFFGVISFVAAEAANDPRLQGKTLPPGWEAAVPNHGKYFQGFLIEKHPIEFGLLVLLLTAAQVTLYFVGKAQRWQRDNGTPAEASAHKKAHIVTVVAIFTSAYLLFDLLRRLWPDVSLN